MRTRRQVIVGGVVAGGVGLAVSQSANAQLQANTDAETDLFVDEYGFVSPKDDPVFGPLITGAPLGGQSVGTGASRHEEISRAFKILWDAPRTEDTLELAKYFQKITDVCSDAKNFAGQPAQYNEEWVGRSNPLITSFFGMTNTLPSSGDQTHWCAAFVSFVLYASGKDTMFSALSGAYRRYSVATQSPKPGDIVVFRKNGDDGDKGFGHVGFFVSQSGSTISVLGGNQRGDTGSTGAVVEAEYPKVGRTLSFHSFRTLRPSQIT